MVGLDSEAEVLSLLKVDPNQPRRLTSRESSRLEFKKSFNWANKGEYARSLAAMSNNRGGYIVYGVNPRPHDLRAVNGSFDRLDDAEVSTYLSLALAPELEWVRFSVDVSGVRLSVLGVAPSSR